VSPALATVVTRIAAKTWGGRWTAEKPLETRESGLDRTQDSRDEDEHAQRNQ